jgi:transcription antitermination factor NusG
LHALAWVNLHPWKIWVTSILISLDIREIAGILKPLATLSGPVQTQPGWKHMLSSFLAELLYSLLWTLFLDAFWNTSPPSEDGEALQTSEFMDVHVESPPLGIAKGLNGGARWFAVYTTCRHEKRIAQHFAQRGIEHYLPLYRADRKWRDGSKVTLELPLFPNYLFVRIKRPERVSVLSVPGALAVVGGTGGEPAPLPDVAIEVLRGGLKEHRIEPHPLLRVGQLARIRSGAFAGMEGIVVRKKSGFRVVLTLEQIMQSVAVELNEDDVEPLTREKIRPGAWLEIDHRLCALGT